MTLLHFLFKLDGKKRFTEMDKWLVPGKILDVGNKMGEIQRDNVDTLDIDNADIIADLNDPLWIRNNEYDNVLAGELIEHLEVPKLFLLEAKRILKPRGRLIISVPNMTGIQHWLTDKDRIKYEKYNVHLYGFDKHMIYNWSKILGMKLLACYRINTFPWYNLFTSLVCMWKPFRPNLIGVFEKK